MSKKNILLVFFLLFKIGFQYLLINPAYELHRDEYLHLDQGKHLAWGYESVPPFTSWISWLILQAGNSVFWIKFFPALCGALTLLIVWKAIETLGGNLFALLLGAIAVTFSAILRMNILFQPNSFDILSWTFLYFTLLKYIQSGHNKWLWLAAIAFGIGFLNKYNIAFLLLGLLPALLITDQRKIFANKHLYYAMGLAVLIIAPNLAWQVRNNFPVFYHLKTLTDTQLVNVSRVDFLKEQSLFFLNSFFILIAGLVSLFTFPPFKKYRPFAWAFLFTLLIFIYFKAKGYYAIGLYPIFLSFGAVYLQHIFSNGWKKYLRPVSIAILLLLFIPMFNIAFPIKSPAEIQKNSGWLKAFGLLRWEDGKDHSLPQDFADMVGWSELAAKADAIFDTITDKKNTLVLCDNYGQAGAINYYKKNKDMQAVTMNADYINWFPLNKMEIKNVIYVKESGDTDRTREKQFFKTITLVGTIENIYAREQGTNIYLLQYPLTSINAILQNEIKERKAKR